MTDWPSSLPMYLTGVQDQRQSTRLRSNVDVGPAIVRKRYTAAVRNVDILVFFSNAERAIFDDFYINTLAEGTFAFNWIDPVSGTAVSFRFRDELGPQFTGESSGDFQAWTATLALEIVP